MQYVHHLHGNRVMHVDLILLVILKYILQFIIYFILLGCFTYISDIEMRMGYLGRLSDLPLNGHIMQPQGLADMVRSNNQIGILIVIF